MNNIYHFCAVSSDEKKHDKETDWSEPTKDERIQEAIERLKSPPRMSEQGLTFDNDACDWMMENFNEPELFLNVAHNFDDPMLVGEYVIKEIMNAIKASCE